MLPIIRSILVISAFGLVACGGGGGGDKKPTPISSSAPASSIPNSTPSSNPSSSQSSVAPSSLPSSASSISSSNLSASSNASAVSIKLSGIVKGVYEQNTGVQLDANQTKVELYLLDSDEKILLSETPIANSYASSSELRFSADLTTTGATSIAITVSHPGYTSFSRKLSVEPQITFEAQLHAVPTVTVQPDTSTSISGATVNGFNIAVNSDDDAQQSDSISIQIPASLLPDGTSSLDVAVRTFDPNDKDDALLFPGAYADSDGNQLASVAFNYAAINTDTGEPLVAAMQKARQQKIAKAGGAQKLAAEEPVIINRQIPEQSCKLLEGLGDSSAELPGFQVPVYTYNSTSGLWDLLGQGTIYTADGQQVAATQSVFNCATANFYLEILVTNEIFLSDWWNLDYPLLFSQPTTYCAQIQVKNPDGQLLPGLTGFVMDNDGTFNFASTYVTTDAEGKAQIRVTQSSTAPDLSAEVIFYNTNEFGYVANTVALSTDCTTPTPQVIELVRPKLCEVSGKFTYDSGQPVTRNLVYGFTTEDVEFLMFNYDFASSNEQGVYRLNLVCGGRYEIFDFATMINPEGEETSQFTTLDGNLDADEVSDDGNSVVMKPRTITLGQPIVSGIYDVTTDRLTLTAYSTFDAFPMSAQVVVKNEDGTITHQTLTGTFNADTFADSELTFYFGGSLVIDTALPDSDGYLLEVTVTNAFGKTWTKIPGFVSTRVPQ